MADEIFRACRNCAYVESRGINPDTLQPVYVCHWGPPVTITIPILGPKAQVVGQTISTTPPTVAGDYWCFQFVPSEGANPATN
jgi:hypothetical protein